MNDARGCGRILPIGMDVSPVSGVSRVSTKESRKVRRDLLHDIVTAALLFLLGNLKGSIANYELGTHLLDRLWGDLVDAQFLLSLGQPEPELAPGAVPGAGREELQHLLGGISRAQWGLVRVERHIAGLIVRWWPGDSGCWCNICPVCRSKFVNRRSSSPTTLMRSSTHEWRGTGDCLLGGAAAVGLIDR